MPPKAKVDLAPSTMKELKDTLWKAADKLRGSMDASQYKDVILGLVFLKYVSDAFEERREQIQAELEAEGLNEEQISQLIDDVDEYTGRGVFWVAPRARWTYLAENAKGLPAAMGEHPKSVGQLIDEAMDMIMMDNKSLAATLPKIYNRDNVDQRRLGELLDLFNSARFTGQGASKARDLLGEVYEYFLEKFAKAEGKRGGEFYTPAGVVRVLVEVLEPHRGRVYDPCCGSGGMFVQAEKFLEAHNMEGSDISVYGQELNERTWRMAKMNLAIHGLNANLASRWGDTFARDQHPELTGNNGADFIMPTRRSTSRTGPAPSPIRAGSTAFPLPATPTTPGFSTSFPNWHPAAAPAWSWPMAPCHPTPAAKARSAPSWWRPTSSPAWLPCPPSYSVAPAFRCARGSSPGTRPRVRAARWIGLVTYSSSTRGTLATWWTAPSVPCPTRTSPRSPTPTTRGVAPPPPLRLG